MRSLVTKSSFIVSLLCSYVINASDNNDFVDLLEPISSISGAFTQTIFDSEGHELERSQGIFKIARPDKMLWEIKTPLEQKIISNGEFLWLYDPDLEQVIIESTELSFNKSPIALFTGDLSLISQRYEIKSKSTESHSDFLLTPLDTSSMFLEIRVYFIEGSPRGISLLDRFNHKTTITFDKVELNPAMADSSFNFIPQPNLDIINNVQ